MDTRYLIFYDVKRPTVKDWNRSRYVLKDISRVHRFYFCLKSIIWSLDWNPFDIWQNIAAGLKGILKLSVRSNAIIFCKY